MATVKKCDICGAVHEYYPEGTDELMYIRTMKRNDSFNANVYGENEMDICPECTKKLLSFIDILKTYPTRYCIDILSEEE